MDKPCKCGSGRLSSWLYDAQNIPVERVCTACEENVKKRFNPWVFTGYNQAFLDEYSGERIEEDY